MISPPATDATAAAILESLPDSGARQRLRLLSCNILAGASIGRYSEYVTRSLRSILPGRSKLANLDLLAKLLGQFDVVGLQEADAGSLRSGFVNQTRYLAEAAGMPFWSHQPNRPVAGLAHSSNGLISRFCPEEIFDYPLPGRIPGRGALLARFDLAGEPLAVVIAHLALSASARMQQLELIADILKGYPHAVLMGDLNAESGSPEMRRLFACSTLEPPPQLLPTFPSWSPRRGLDHILVSPSLRLDTCRVLPQAFSDHLPIAADVWLPAALSPSRTAPD